MCGIICLIKNGIIDIEIAKKCLSKIVPRGPDMQNYKLIQHNNIQIFFGFTRLAIMDMSDAGSQPMTNSDEDMIICNGEIYNYLSLSKEHNIELSSSCDCEILLPLIKKLGIINTVTNEIDAEFAMVTFLKSNAKIHAVRDRYGVRPLYYGYNKECEMIGFASELKALHDIMEYVEQVKPNKMITVNLNQNILEIETSVYDNYSNINSIGFFKNVECIHSMMKMLLTSAVSKRLSSDREIGFLLSGGLDSSLIVAIASRIIGADKMVCFSVGFENSPDVIAAKQVTNFLGIKNHHIIPFNSKIGIDVIEKVIQTTETYDITTIRASTPQYIMAEYIKNNTNVKVILSGEGSDEIHGSYRYFRDAPNSTEFHNESARLLEELYLFDNKRTDRTMAGNGLEVRVPFLDFEYVKFIYQINPSLLMYTKDNMEKKLLRDSFTGYLPNEILYRSKEAFSDAVSSNDENWANNIKKYVEEISINNEYKINPPKTKEALYYRNIFDKYYKNRCNIIPHYWLPRFQKVEMLDPSARELKCY